MLSVHCMFVCVCVCVCVCVGWDGEEGWGGGMGGWDLIWAGCGFVSFGIPWFYDFYALL